MRVPNFTKADAIAIGLDRVFFKFPKAGIPITRAGLQKQYQSGLDELFFYLAKRDDESWTCTRFLPAHPSGCWVCQTTNRIDAILLLLTGDVE